jgi:uncharacterized protein (TIGR02145 family)
MNIKKQLAGTSRYILISLVMVFFCNLSSAQEKGTFKDARDGRIYQWVKIGKKTWMAENLKFNATQGSWAFNSDTANVALHGRLYTWTAATTACPKGWVLPTDNDWTLAIAKLGGTEVAGGKFQEMDSLYWNANPNLPATAKTISSLLGGVMHGDNTFTGESVWGGLWSATLVADVPNNYLFARGDKSIGKSSNDKSSAFGVRCVKK